MSLPPALFPDLLGHEWPRLGEAVRRVHGGSGHVLARGMADVEGSPRVIARCLRKLLSLPEPGPRQAVEVRIERHGPREIWTRRFSVGQMRTVLDRKPDTSLLRERFGPLAMHFALERRGESIRWRLAGARLLGLPLPRAVFGQVLAHCGERDGRYEFDIDTRLPLLGQLVAYRGWLEPIDAA